MFYNTSLRTWTKVKLGFVLTVKEQDHIFLKALNVTDCLNFNHHFNNQDQHKSHIFDQLPQQRFSVHSRHKQCLALASTAPSTPSVISLSDDSDGYGGDSECLPTFKPTSPPAVIEIIEIPSDDSGDKVHLHPQPQPSCIKIEETEETGYFVSRIVSCKREISGSSTSSSPIPVWPSQLYVVDLMKGFALCEEACLARKNIGQAFSSFFGVPFHSTTFYENWKCWEEALQTVRDQCISAGHTMAGLWATFVKLQKGQAKGAKMLAKKVRVN